MFWTHYTMFQYIGLRSFNKAKSIKLNTRARRLVALPRARQLQYLLFATCLSHTWSLPRASHILSLGSCSTDVNSANVDIIHCFFPCVHPFLASSYFALRDVLSSPCTSFLHYKFITHLYGFIICILQLWTDCISLSILYFRLTTLFNWRPFITYWRKYGRYGNS